jgi:uncharacterized protein YjbI with pentapeptide repeats
MNKSAESIAVLPSPDTQRIDNGSTDDRWLRDDSGAEDSSCEIILGELRESCKKGSKARPAEMDLRGVSFAGEDLSGLDLSKYDLSGADLSGANLSQSSLSWAKLEKANLFKATLEGCEFLRADLTSANLNECQARRAGFGAANLTKASLVGADLREAAMTEARLCGADFRAAKLKGASLRHADLSHVNFTRADIEDADLKQSDVQGTDFHVASLRGARLLGMKNFDKALWVGADIRGMDLRGAYLIKRHIMDANYLFEFKSRSKFHEILYWIWWLTSDCGRSLSRWALFIAVVAAVFAGLYNVVEVDFGANRTAFSPFYYSIVTLTTLGYGDVVPVSTAAQIVASIEALLGYIGLGGLLSILSNKMARRAE